MTDDTVAVTEARVLEGPNLYFPRPAAKLVLRLPGYLSAPADDVAAVASAVGVRARRVGEPGSELRQRVMVRLAERALRLIATAAGTSRLAVRSRVGEHPDEVVVAFPLRTRERAAGMASALTQVLAGLLAARGEGLEQIVQPAGDALRQADAGETLRPARPKIPVVAVTGTNGKTTTTRLIAHLAMSAGRRTGWSSTDGVLVDGVELEHGDYSGPAGARTVLEADGVDFAVLETARGGMLFKGLGTAYNDVSVVTNVSADHLGQNGIHTLDHLAEVKAIITRVTRPSGWVVLNGDDPRVWAMRAGASAPVWCFSLDPASPALRDALTAHGRGITVLDGTIVVLKPGETPSRLIDVVDVPMTLAGLSRHNMANALAGAAAGLGAGLPAEAVIEGLRTFAPDAQHNAGRMNTYTLSLAGGGEVTVILDMAHNEGGLEALLEVASGLRQPGASVILGLGTGGDRTDDILRNLGELAGRDADRVHIQHKEKYLRERTMTDLEAKLVEGLARVGVTPVSSSPTELEGLQALIADAHDGDVLALMTHQSWSQLHQWLLDQGAQPDDAKALRHKVIGARGEHEAQDRITALWQIEDPYDRIAAGEALLADYPTDARVLYEHAGTFDSAGEEEAALTAYDRALATGLREPHRRRALIQKASTLRHLGRLEESLAILDELRAAWPDNEAVAVFRSLTLHDLGRDADALGDLSRWLVAHSTDVDVERYRRSLTRFTGEIGS
ncbi:tetratricopeptide repeat protein [Calidifontibacter sp. DB0510]|uniref:Tetratricopeptide repeat protein n=1 Tax=Metallococcus carri TaxID=1656884 RepID=A0A967AZW3_9MICO|nr:tetratricopeptide repeat protein [Metallococcus carri]NHN54875.1 tetratricopeptide repeat protein [Metallococcus carri]NOP37220.1 tetratricopeptide repeat protein [Calidifontibacter sp. DB2511S]